MNEVTPVLIPQEIVNDETVTILSWKMPTGSKVDEGQIIVELETSKTAFDLPSPRAGFVHYTLKVGAEPAIGSLLCYITDTADKPAAAGAVNGTPTATNGQAKPASAPVTEAKIELAPTNRLSEITDRPADAEMVRFSKKAAALIAQHKLDASIFDKRGLVREQDVLEHLNGGKPAAVAAPAESASTVKAVAGPVAAAGVPVRDEPLARAKKMEIKYLASGSANALPSAVSISVPTRGLRAAVESVASVGGNATAVIVFEVSRLLKKYPLFNAYYDDGHAKLYEQVNIGLAVDAGKGLKVPVIRDTDLKSIGQVSDEMGELVQAYLADTLAVEALAAGTFTITDLSGENVTYFHPLINRGQGAILGVGAEHFPPGSSEGVFNLILAFDHQLGDGRMAGKFLGELFDRLTAYERAAEYTATQSKKHCSNCQRELSPAGSTRFLVPVMLPDGSKGQLCPICFNGWT